MARAVVRIGVAQKPWWERLRLGAGPAHDNSKSGHFPVGHGESLGAYEECELSYS